MRSRGFTLIELLVILTISAILVAMAVPSFQAMIRTNRISGASNSMLSALDLARSEAIRRGANVVICRSVNSEAVNPACSSGASGGFNGDDWAAGWIVFAKAPANADNDDVEVGDEIVMRQARFQPDAAERLIIESNFGNPQSFFYNLRGFSAAVGTMFFDDRAKIDPVRSNMARCIRLNITGRPHVARVVADACPAA